LSPEEVRLLHAKKVCVIGCGGLGGFVVENLARLGILHITVVDCDVFEPSNLNRQLYSSESAIGAPKVEAAAKRIGEINSEVRIIGLKARFDEATGVDLLAGHDAVIDALDNIPSRLLLAEICRTLGIPLIHGSIAGWFGQVAAIFPGDKTMEILFGGIDTDKGMETSLGNLPFTAALIASLQSAECVKILTGRGEILRNALLLADLLSGEFRVLPLLD